MAHRSSTFAAAARGVIVVMVGTLGLLLSSCASTTSPEPLLSDGRPAPAPGEVRYPSVQPDETGFLRDVATAETMFANEPQMTDGEALEFGREVCATATRDGSLPASLSESDAAETDPVGVALTTMLVKNAVQRLCPWHEDWSSEQLYFSSTSRYADLMVDAYASRE